MMCITVSGCASFWDRDGDRHTSNKNPELLDAETTRFFQERARNIKFESADERQVQLMKYEVPPAPESIVKIPDAEVRHMTLLEAVYIALSENIIIPVNSEFLGNGPLMTNPEAVASKYDPAIRNAGVQTFQQGRGVDAAISDFIPMLSSQYTYGQDENIQNNLFSGGLAPGEVLNQTNGNYALQLRKFLGTGGNLALSQKIDFDENNVPSRLFPNAYNSQLSFDLTQPLLQGAGREFTAIAGPLGLISQRSPTMNQGILISSINVEISEQELHQVLQRLVRDVTEVYWDLYFAHRQYEIETLAHEDAEVVWKKAQAKRIQGVGEGIADEAQARENYLAAKGRMVEAQKQVALIENRFRRLLNLPTNPHQIIKPFDTPRTERPAEDWMQMLMNAFGNRSELKQTKMLVHSLSLQLKAAHKYAQPRLDFVGNFHTNGFGDQLVHNSARITNIRNSSLQNLANLDQTGWTAGVAFSMPVDRKLQRTLVRQLELRLAKANAALSAQEQEITRELTYAMKSADGSYQLIQTTRDRLEAAREQVNALDAAFPTGRVSIDRLVRAQAILAQAKTEHERSLTAYNKDLAELDFRQGILLDASQVTIITDTWRYDE